MGQFVGRRKGSVIGISLVTVAMLVGTSACSGGGSSDKASGGDGKADKKSSAPPSPTKPKGPPMLLDTITPQSGATVGVAMPVSVVFTNPVAAKARESVEKHMKVSTSTPVKGAWHWFGDRRADWRPKTYWPSGTKVKVDADMKGVSNGNGRYGVHGYTHTFKVGDDVRADVSVSGHTLKVTKDGKALRTLSINAGSAEYPTWNGTMAVIDKQKKVHMTSCSVGISCDKGSPNYYDLTLPWDVHLTQSGTYVHYSTGDPNPGSGSARGSHGCVHLSMADAKWFYGQVKQGDPITITGSPRAKAPADNGYAAFNLSWDQWLQGSASGQGTSAAL
ncbi:L,D-transpeptidase [Streptomyces sp. NBC_01016]|uniref:L,D-transpeptidase n=1 Tax=Streptomyces sp. NBC_01016 TaxID=2903720 RepID=UPI0022582904|nr:L,D-transpeptidase [Streptomyces sp. NBC_01016]MCX4829463.1 L,D-transpeptidase [Streptomyces sp. NBC_01016]